MLLKIAEAGSLGPTWEKEFWLVRRRNGTYLIRCYQTIMYEEDRADIPTRDDLTSGEDVWYALAGMVNCLGAYSMDAYDTNAIVANVAVMDGRLADEVRQAASEHVRLLRL